MTEYPTDEPTNPHQDQTGMAPPLEPGPDEFAPRPLWPKAFGIISIVLASLGLICYGCGSGANVMGQMMSGSVQQQQVPQPSPVQQALQIGGLCLSFALSIWLLIAGIGLVRFRSWATKQHTFWAMAKITITVVVTALNFVFVDETVKAINDQFAAQAQRTGGSVPFTATKELAYIFFAASFVLYMIYPLIVILFMMKEKVKNEVALWIEADRNLV